jgi:hypothetical protein
MKTDSETPRSARQTRREAPLGENPESIVIPLQMARLRVTSFVLE